MENNGHHVTASVEVYKKQNTLSLVLELPQDFVRLAVDAHEDDVPNRREKNDPEHAVIMDAIRDADFAEAAIQRLSRNKWASVLQSLKRLKALPSVLGLLTSLLSLEALWAVMSVSDFQFIVEMATKHEQVVSCYLRNILNRWSTILDPVKQLDFMPDPKSVEALAGLWPRANLRDRQRVDALFSRKDFLPSLKNPQNRATLRRELNSLDGRVLTLSMLLTELRLLKKAAACKTLPAIERSNEPQALHPQYWEEWAPRFAALCSQVRGDSGTKRTGQSKSRNVYQSKEVFFTSCRWCHDTALRQGIWRFQDDLTPFFIAPATQPPDLPDPQNLPLQGLIFDFLRCFFSA